MFCVKHEENFRQILYTHQGHWRTAFPIWFTCLDVWSGGAARLSPMDVLAPITSYTLAESGHFHNYIFLC